MLTKLLVTSVLVGIMSASCATLKKEQPVILDCALFSPLYLQDDYVLSDRDLNMIATHNKIFEEICIRRRM